MDVSFRIVAKGIRWFLLLFIVNFSDASRLDMASQTLEVKKLLNRLNKTPLQSITSPDGDIIDCVRVADQPAFDHPLLKNHTIQMSPSYHPEGLAKGDEMQINQLWHLSGSCPEGTVPIRRTKEEDVLRASSVERFGKKHHNKSILKQGLGFGHEHAVTSVEEGKYYGTKAIMNVWNPHVQDHYQFSVAQIWIVRGPFSDLNSIEAGWLVYPHLYGDSRTRLFIYWTSDGYKSTGCYNLMCSGFIQINNKIALGASISHISTYGGSQHSVRILVWRDPKRHNWWLQFGNTILGFWPENMFTHLLEGASRIDWGGEVFVNPPHKRHSTTQMGSGHFPREGFKKASYFKNIQIVDGSNKLRDPHRLSTFIKNSKCYSLSLHKSKLWGNYFYFGGPGRNPNCP